MDPAQRSTTEPASQPQQSPVVERPGRSPSLGLRLGVLAGLAAVSGLLVAATDRLETMAASPYPMTVTVPWGGGSPGDPRLATQIDESMVPQVAQFTRGDTIERILERAGLEREAVVEAGRAVARVIDPRALRAGDDYAVWHSEDHEPQLISWTIAEEGKLHIERRGERWHPEVEPFQRSVTERVAFGALEGSLEGSLRAAGAPAVLSLAMADVLQWDIDFNRDLRAGDRFWVAWQEIQLDGEFHRVGSVEALVYENGSRQLEAYRFGEDGAYFDAEGRPLRKQFLRSPLPYSRVTSKYTNRRFHPVLKTYRPHYGVDYGAPVGTAVRVTASGTVSFAAWDKGGGKVVKVRHTNGFETAYLHLSRYAEGISRGARVVQGQVIGYVGKTGLATGPHLDYRVKRNGRYMDPLRLADDNPPAEPIDDAQRAAFEAERERLRRELSWRPPAGDRLAAGS